VSLRVLKVIWNFILLKMGIERMPIHSIKVLGHELGMMAVFLEDLRKKK
jgi:hypothetical protein